MGDLSLNFSRSEFACRDECGFDTVDVKLHSILIDLRHWANHGDPKGPYGVHLNSGCRCEDHNREVGGEPDSQHLFGRAADVRVDGKTPDQVADYLESKYPRRYGIGRYNTFTHVDSRTYGPARWDRR